MPTEYQKDGDVGFMGLNSRQNPASLPAGIVSKSQNFRFDRGVATVRKGLQRKTSNAILGLKIYGTGTILDLNGQESFIIVVTDGLFTYNPQTETFSSKVSFPTGETVVDADIAPPNSNGMCDVVVAVDKVYITRGHSKRPLIATLDLTTYLITSVTAAVTTGTGSTFPNCNALLYYANRLIANGKSTYESSPYTRSARSRDTVNVSHYLQFDGWDSGDAFFVNEGTNDETMALSPFTLNDFIVFMRNSIFYINVGSGRYANNGGLSTDASLKNLVSDIGCLAKKSIVLADGGLMFLSDNGVYRLDPNQVGTNETLRLLTNSRPISDPIDDVMQRINKPYAYKAVATYWANRYYLAIPIDGSTVNNVVVVYNFILKQWESVDTFPTGFNVFSFGIAKKNDQRRLYAFSSSTAADNNQGIFLMEELEYDEYGASTGTPVLPFYIPTLLSASAFTPNQINAQLTSRLYTFNVLKDKRFSTVETDIICEAGSQIKTYVDTLNPDTTTLVDSFGSEFSEDSTRRVAVRKIGYGLQMRYITNNLRSSIRAINLTATLLGKQNISKK